MASSQKGIGVPVKLIHEAEGHVVTIELKTGEMYRGELFDVEDNWNCQVKDVTATAKDGRVSQLDHIYVRGSRIRFVIVPDMLKNAPMFKRIDPKNKGKVRHRHGAPPACMPYNLGACMREMLMRRAPQSRHYQWASVAAGERPRCAQQQRLRRGNETVAHGSYFLIFFDVLLTSSNCHVRDLLVILNSPSQKRNVLCEKHEHMAQQKGMRMSA